MFRCWLEKLSFHVPRSSLALAISMALVVWTLIEKKNAPRQESFVQLLCVCGSVRSTRKRMSHKSAMQSNRIRTMYAHTESKKKCNCTKEAFKSFVRCVLVVSVVVVLTLRTTVRHFVNAYACSLPPRFSPIFRALATVGSATLPTSCFVRGSLVL